MDNIEYLKTLGVVDLISEKHKQLRQVTMEEINAQCDHKFSQMDVYLISLVHYQPMSVSESARYMNISRQAAHKHVKQLVELGYIDLTSSSVNRRDKIVTLTEAGLQLSKQLHAIKATLEAKLEKCIGAQEYAQIKRLFMGSWEL